MYIFLVLNIAVLIAVIVLIFAVLSVKKNNEGMDKFSAGIREEFERSRNIIAQSGREARTESLESLLQFQDSLSDRLDAFNDSTQNTLSRQHGNIRQTLNENRETLLGFQNSLSGQINDFMNTLSGRFDVLTAKTQESLALQQENVRGSLKEIRESNEKKLEEMRITVDEKLQSTLEKRLSSSFEVVGKQLEAVQKGLGAMQTLAGDVGGLKRALTNVKTAGGIGEVQLEGLLSHILSPEQYEKNAHPNPSRSTGVVEFAVKIPDKECEKEYIYLPVDSKYPATVWDNLTLAYEAGDKEGIEQYRKALVRDIKSFAKDIKEKYIEVPYTTDFGIMFIPFEGLFSEIIRIPGLIQQIQDDYRVVITGPATLTALLCSLQMGFRTLAIRKETSRIWDLMGEIRSEFGKFGDILAATKKKLDSASNEIEKAESRSRQIKKRLDKLDSIEDIGSLDKLTDN